MDEAFLEEGTKLVTWVSFEKYAHSLYCFFFFFFK